MQSARLLHSCLLLQVNRDGKTAKIATIKNYNYKLKAIGLHCVGFCFFTFLLLVTFPLILFPYPEEIPGFQGGLREPSADRGSSCAGEGHYPAAVR